MLAILGGSAEYKRKWPAWPQISSPLVSKLTEKLSSERWSISGPWCGKETSDQELAQQFRAFIGTKFCIPTDHGTSGLMMAMRVLGVGPGDEVIIPALTWVACASTVLEIGALPVFVDIDPNTQCMSASAVEAAISPRTRAIMLVHLNSALANLDAFCALSEKTGIPLIEDCSQCHGADWRERKAGAFGKLGVFSLHQGKLLASGEGGLVVTNDEELAHQLELIRGNGRVYKTGSEVRLGQQHLAEVPGTVGRNMAMTEFQSLIALDGLSRLSGLNEIRSRNASLLDNALIEIPGILPIKPHTQNTGRAYYHYATRLELPASLPIHISLICEALTAELGTWAHPTYVPLTRNVLFRPQDDPYYIRRFGKDSLIRILEASVPNSFNEYNRCILLHHSVLLGNEDDMQHIVAAFKKVYSGLEKLAKMKL